MKKIIVEEKLMDMLESYLEQTSQIAAALEAIRDALERKSYQKSDCTDCKVIPSQR